MLRTTITLSQDEVDNLVEFFELEFLPMVQKVLLLPVRLS